MDTSDDIPTDVEKSGITRVDHVLHTDPESSLEKTGEPIRPEDTTWKTWIVISVSSLRELDG